MMTRREFMRVGSGFLAALTVSGLRFARPAAQSAPISPAHAALVTIPFPVARDKPLTSHHTYLPFVEANRADD